MADLGAYDKALAWLDDQPAADGNFHALALEALIDGLGCTWAVAVAVDTRGPVVLASRCRDGESQYEPKDARPPHQPDAGDRYWFVANLAADQGVAFTSCHGHLLHDEAGQTAGYILAMDRRTMADDAGAVMFFRLIAERMSRHLARAAASAGQRPADLDGGALDIPVTSAEAAAPGPSQSIADRYLNAIDSMSDGVALWDEDDTLVICNRRFKEFSTGDIRLLRGDMNFEDFLRKCAEGGSFDLQGAALETAIQERLEVHRNPPNEIEVRRLGRTLSIREQQTPDGGTITIAVDMTQQHQFEAQLHQAQKMVAVGQLTGGIAHDFNNLLAVISGNLELLDKHANNDVNLTRFIERGLAAAERGAQLTNRLLAFSRPRPLAARTATMDRLIEGMRDLVRRTLGETIRIKTTIDADPWPCLVDVSQLENAILNLAINARDAMPDGGDLTIETSNLDLMDGAAAQRRNLKPGCYVTLSVSDTGTGMEADVIDRASIRSSPRRTWTRAAASA